MADTPAIIVVTANEPAIIKVGGGGTLVDDGSGNIVLGAGKGIYLGGKTTEGTWRFIRNGNDLHAERYESGIWVLGGGFTTT